MTKFNDCFKQYLNSKRIYLNEHHISIEKTIKYLSECPIRLTKVENENYYYPEIFCMEKWITLGVMDWCGQVGTTFCESKNSDIDKISQNLISICTSFGKYYPDKGGSYLFLKDDKFHKKSLLIISGLTDG